MAIEYSYNPQEKIIRTECKGDIDTRQIVEYLQRLLADPAIVYGSTEVFSLEQATNLRMSYDEVSIFREIWADYKPKVGNRVIVIAPTDLTYGLFRMLVTAVSMGDPQAEDDFILVKSKDECARILNKK